jgi:filamentous hemagglutinin family protein
MKLKLLAIPILISALPTNAEVTLDGTLGRRGALPGPDYQIGADLGQQRGGNLFHSFQDFNLNRAESATFSGPNSVNNVISRVTGGNPSQIDGLIRSTIPNADMYLLNPHGIMFGKNAKLDVQGGFHASTADYLRLKDGGRFDARQPNNSILTVAPVEAFGFLTNSPAPLSVESSLLFVPPEKTLSLIGGHLAINQAELAAPYGRLNLASVAGIGEVIPKYDDFVVPTLRGDITVQDSQISTNGEGGGAIYIRGGQFVLDNSMVEADTHGAIDGIGIDVQADALIATHGGKLTSNVYGTGRGGDIKVKVTGPVNLSGENDAGNASSIEIDNYGKTENAGSSGTLELEANQLHITDGAKIGSTTFGTGQGGDVTVHIAGPVKLEGETKANDYVSGIFANSQTDADNAGNGGNLVLEAEELVITDGAAINVSTWGAGKSGNVTVRIAGPVKLEGETKANNYVSGIFANSQTDADNAGNGGNLVLEAEELVITDGAAINVSTWGAGNGGNMNLKIAGNVLISGECKNATCSSNLLSSSTSEADNAGNAGNIVLEAGNLHLKNGADISAKTNGSGQGGDIKIRVTGSVSLSGERSDGYGSYIYADTSGTTEKAGKGGSIELEAEQLFITDGGRISTNTWGPGQGGSTSIKIAGNVLISGESRKYYSGIFSSSKSEADNAGNAGTLVLEAGELHLKNGTWISADTRGAGEGGDIKIRVNGLFKVEGKDSSGIGSFISAETFSKTEKAGSSGNIELEAKQLQITDGGKIRTTTRGPGEGGNIYIKVAKEVILSDESGIFTQSKSEADNGGNAGTLVLETGKLHLINDAQIRADTRGAGEGGDIKVRVNGLVKLEGISAITGQTFGKTDNAGNCGNIELEAGQLYLTASAISAITFGTGEGGKIHIKVKDNVILSRIGFILVTSNHAGNAGDIVLEAGRVILENNARINASTLGSGQGGNITVHADHVRMLEGGYIAADSTGQGNAGHIVLFIENALKIQNDAVISTQTNSADGGNITITSPGYIYLTHGGQITTSVGAEKGDGGNITLNPEFIILDNGKIIARAKEGQGGNIDINTTGIYRFPPESASSIDASSELGIDGVVTIDSPNENVTKGLLTLPTTPIDTGTLSKDACAVHSWEEYINRSRFEVHPIAGSPPSPYDLTPSRLSNTNKTDRQSSVIPEEQLF